jgi:hypothetical protein
LILSTVQFHLVIAPPETIDTNLVTQAAGILAKDPYSTRLLLAGKIPKIIAHYPTRDLAETVVKQLRAIGISSFVCTDSDLARPVSGFRAHRLQFGEGEVTFFGNGPEKKTILANDAFLILAGIVQIRSEKETTNTKMKFSLPATIITGGFPVWRKVKETTKEQTFQSEYFVRVYDRVSSDPVIEILQNDFDYSVLGTSLAYASLPNLKEVISRLRKLFSAAIFDDVLTGPTGPRDDIETDCKLIYLGHRAKTRNDL